MIIYKNSLDIYRLDSQQAYSDDDGNWIEPQASEEVLAIRCSIQPYVNGNEKIELPDGAKAEDAYYVFTKSFIRQADDRVNQSPDETIIDGIRYECFRVKNYRRYGFPTDHYECVFLRKDKL